MPCAQKLTATSHNYHDNRSKQEGGGTVVTTLHEILPTASEILQQFSVPVVCQGTLGAWSII